MKTSFIFLVLLNLIVLGGFAQVPNYFNYQAVVRNTTGEVVANTDVSFRISILQGSESGSAVYVETHTIRTNEFGLVNLKIGDGTVVGGSFNPSNWGGNSHFIKVEMDSDGGSAYAEFGTSQLMSVPYAFHAKTVENDEVEDADADATNEIQSLSISGTQLTLSDGGGTVTLPSSGAGDNWGTQTVESDATLSGDGTSSNPLSVVGGLSPWQTENENIYFDSGKVTVGSNTPNPNGLLSLNGKSKNAWISLNNDATGNTLSDGLVIGPRLTDGAVYFWNLENTPVIFSTNNKEQMVITEDGDVGIGTVNTNTNGLLTIHGRSSNAWISFNNDATGNLASDGLVIGQLYNNNGVYVWNLENTPIKMATNNKVRMTLAANGYLGLGTESPSAALHLKGTGYPSSFMYLESNSGQDAGFRLYEGTTAKWHIFNNAVAGGLQIYNSAVKTAIFAKQSNSYVGIGTTSPAYALHVNGDAAKTSGSTAWIISSDKRLKNIHGTYDKGLAEILELQPICYNYKEDNPRQLPSKAEQVGFVAQEVQKIFPEAVCEREDGYLDFNIHSINVAMVNAVKDLNKENDHLKKKIKDLESRLEKLEYYFELRASEK